MDEYTRAAEQASRDLTRTFSTSFSSAITLFPKQMQQHIYNIYGLVRIADEVVDTYQAAGSDQILNDLEQEVYASLRRGFSANLIVHAFCLTAHKYGIKKQLIAPFFESMRMDLTKKSFNQAEYARYIYGSAEVVGLMCLRVYIDGNETKYSRLKPGACALGSAFQKVNFLRDIKDDYETRGRYYFPRGSFESFSEADKIEIVKDIKKDFFIAKPAIQELPPGVRSATKLAYDYYHELLRELTQLPAEEILSRRISVSRQKKMQLLLRAKLKVHA